MEDQLDGIFIAERRAGGHQPALDCAPARIRLWIVLAAWCGLRACEISGLRRECIRETSVPPTLLVAADATKGIEERVIPLSPFVVCEVGAAGLPSHGYAFARCDGRAGPNTAQLVSHLANEHLHAAGTASTLHSLRHRCLTEHYRATRDLRQTQEIAGHKDPATTAKYVAIVAAESAASMAAIPVPPATMWSHIRKASQR